MTGYHSVRAFPVERLHEKADLPEGWKPFAVIDRGQGLGGYLVVARKWVRT